MFMFIISYEYLTIIMIELMFFKNLNKMYVIKGIIILSCKTSLV